MAALLLLTIAGATFQIGCAAPVKMSAFPGPEADYWPASECKSHGFANVRVVGLLPAEGTFEEVGYMTVSQKSSSELLRTSIEDQITAARVQACEWGADAIVMLNDQSDKGNTWGAWTGLSYRDERESRIVAIRYLDGARRSRATPPATASLDAASAGFEVESGDPWLADEYDLWSRRSKAQPMNPHAIREPDPYRGSIWFRAHGTFGTYAMSDLNDEIEAVNDLISPFHMDDVSSGPGFGFDVGGSFGTAAHLGFGYERLVAKTDVGDHTGSLSYDTSANVIRGSLEFMPRHSYPARAGFGIGLGAIMADGTFRVSADGFGSEESDISGMGLLLEGYGIGELRTNSGVAFFGVAGFRYAEVGEIRVDDDVVYNGQNSKYTLDYSGAVFRAGVKIE